MSQEADEAASAGDGVQQGEGDHKHDTQRDHQAEHEPTLERAREWGGRDECPVGFSGFSAVGILHLLLPR